MAFITYNYKINDSTRSTIITRGLPKLDHKERATPSRSFLMYFVDI